MKTILIILLIVVSGNLYAQDWNSLLIPNETKHAEDLFTITRPALSLRGWDNTRDGSQTTYYTSLWQTTRGVKQVLESSFEIDETREKTLFKSILSEYVKTIKTGLIEKANDIDDNAVKLESRAFVALMMYIIEKNPSVFTQAVRSRVANLPANFEVARASMVTAFQQLIKYHLQNETTDGARFFTNRGKGNTFKNTTAIMAVARAFDLYLALENATVFFEDTVTEKVLLTDDERRKINAQLANEIDLVYRQTSVEAVVGVQADEAQAGNWPLISKIGNAYAALGMNGVSILNSSFDLNYFKNRIKDGIVAASPVRTPNYTSQIRKNHFYYQTQGNSSFAEGFYYYKITLQKLIPFYNVFRTNQVSELVTITGVADPIRHPNFEKTLHWVADLSTPDGKTLPLDDGNKVFIDVSEILSWSNAFGNQEIGSKYAWIKNKIPPLNIGNWYNTTSIAIPKSSTPTTSPLSNVYPYNGLSDYDQLAVRFTDNQNRNHMVVLNTESLLAVEPGEGHEQPDQLQLLYYVDRESVLADAGYDSGGKFEWDWLPPSLTPDNSTWSKMSNHNVFRAFGFENLSDPQLYNGSYTGKKAGHGGVKSKNIQTEGNITTLSATMEINGATTADGYLIKADYKRSVLLINSDNNVDSYLIDSNSHIFDYDINPNNFMDKLTGISYLFKTQNYSYNQWGISNFYFVDNLKLNVFVGFPGFKTLPKSQIIRTNQEFREIYLYEGYENGTRLETSFKMEPNDIATAWEKNIISIFSTTNKSLNIERFYEDVYKGNPEYSGEYVAYKIDHGNSLDFIVKRILWNGIGGNNPNFDGWNMRFKHGAIHFEFPGGNEFAFARYTNQNGKWALDETRSLNIVDKTVDLITQNVTIGNTQSLSPFKNIQIANNVIITVNGNANFEGKILKMGNNSKIRFLSGTPNLKDLTLESALATDTYTVEVGIAYQLKIKSGEKISLSGRLNLTGYNMRIDLGGELEIKDGSIANYSDSFTFLNYGTFEIGAGVILNVKNLNNYSSSNTLINTNNGSRTNFNISAGGVINLGGAATVKGTTFRRKTTSNFSYVGISGSAVRSFENVAIEGSQYGILVSNVPSGKVSFKSITGNNNFYSTIKANNAVFTLDGIITTNSVQDGLAAYSASTIKLTGYHSYENSLIGIRAAQYSTVTNGNEINRLPLDLSIINNTRGIHVYTNGDVNLLGTELEPLMVWLNRRTDNVYNVDDYDLYATLDGKITLSYYQNIGNISIYEDAPEDVNLINPIPSSGFQNNGYAKVNDDEGLIETNRTNSAKSKKDLLKNYRLLLKESSKQALADYLNVNKNHSSHDIKSTAEVLFVLHASQSSDFVWVNSYDKLSRLKSLNDEDAVLIAEQLFYYYTNTEPQQTESAYWLKQLKKMGHELYETGIFDVLYDQAAFNQEVAETEETEQVESEKNTILAYPNPFNPTTSLKLSLKNKAQVQIQVFDIMGRLVQTLANNEQWQSGTHEVQFDASRLASGMYFARTQILESGKAVQTQVSKLMLIK